MTRSPILPVLLGAIALSGGCLLGTSLPPEVMDADGDGFTMVEGDCDDAVAAVYPGAVEIIGDGIDQNCDGGDLCYADVDQDGYGLDSRVIIATNETCDTYAGEATVGGDCNDADGETHPGASEIVADGRDQDCDAKDACYADEDADGWGTLEASTLIPLDIGCVEAEKGAANAGDCDDGDSTISPTATEVTGDGIDSDCDGQEFCFHDGDGDGWGTSDRVVWAPGSCSGDGVAENAEDCDDTNAAVYPGAPYYLDADNDSYGDASTAVASPEVCEPGERVANDDDCDDEDASVNPRAVEVPGNDVDEDCSGALACFGDGDGDGFGAEVIDDAGVVGCLDEGEADVGGDCDDTDGDVSPMALERPNVLDDNCNGVIDEGIFQLCYEPPVDAVGGWLGFWRVDDDANSVPVTRWKVNQWWLPTGLDDVVEFDDVAPVCVFLEMSVGETLYVDGIVYREGESEPIFQHLGCWWDDTLGEFTVVDAVGASRDIAHDVAPVFEESLCGVQPYGVFQVPCSAGACPGTPSFESVACDVQQLVEVGTDGFIVDEDTSCADDGRTCVVSDGAASCQEDVFDRRVCGAYVDLSQNAVLRALLTSGWETNFGALMCGDIPCVDRTYLETWEGWIYHSLELQNDEGLGPLRVGVVNQFLAHATVECWSEDQVDLNLDAEDEDGDCFCEHPTYCNGVTTGSCTDGVLPGDCDDTNADIHPDAVEQLDLHDRDGSGAVDDQVSIQTPP